MKIVDRYYSVIESLAKMRDIPLLSARLILAYGFYGPAMMKLNDVHAVAEWFNSMGMFLPSLNAYLATSAEILGVILLTLGLGTRLITFPLMITMLVAIKTVHWENGFNAGDNGFEIPLYYLIMLFMLMIFGAGKISLDYLISTHRKKNKQPQ